MTRAGRIRPTLIVLLVVALLALGLVWGLAAAGASDGSPSAVPEDAASADPGTVIYKVGILAEPDNLNPFVGWLWSSFEVWYLNYDPLVGYDHGKLTPMKGEDSPGLATDWTVSADDKTWTFTIRSGVKWQDGEPLTARDVAFTYNYVIDNDLTNFTTTTEGITKAVAVDDTTVRFECDKPKANMLLAYSNDLEAFNTAKWTGYAASPNEMGNVLFPPYGNAGSENFLLIEPKTGTATEEGGGSATLWIAVAVGALIAVLLAVLLLRGRRTRATKE